MYFFAILLQTSNKPDIQALLHDLTRQGGAFEAATMAMVAQTLLIGEVLCLIFIPVTIGWSVLSKTWGSLESGEPRIFDVKEMGRLMLLYSLLNVFYTPCFGALMEIAGWLARITFTGALTEYEVSGDNSTSWWDYMMGALNVLAYGLVQAGVRMVAEFVSYIVTVYAYFVSRILYVIGPLAIAFSIIPAFKDKLSAWFGMYLNCLCVPFTLNIINGVFYNMSHALLKGRYISGDLFIIFNICYIVVICLAFWITSFYVGSSGASKIMSMAVAFTTALASQGFKLLSKLGQFVKNTGGGAGGGSGNVIEK